MEIETEILEKELHFAKPYFTVYVYTSIQNNKSTKNIMLIINSVP